MVDFTDFLNFSNASPDLGKALSSAFVAAQQRPLIQAQQARALSLQQQEDAAFKAFTANPSATNASTLMAFRPKDYEAIKAGHEAKTTEERNAEMREYTELSGYIGAGNISVAKDRLKRRIDADRAAGVDTTHDQELYDTLDIDPKTGLGIVNAHIAGIVGPDRLASVIKTQNDVDVANRKLPGEIAKTAAETDKIVTDTALAPIETANRQALNTAQITKMREDTRLAGERLGLDTERLQAEKEKWLTDRQITLSNLPPQALTAVNKAADDASAARQLSERARNLADNFDAAPNVGPATGATLSKFLAAATGNPSEVVQLRRQWTQLKNAQASANLPPGAASDADVKMALQGFPKDTDSRESISKFLRGMEKYQTLVAEQADRRGEWLDGNRGSLGPARSVFFVGNDTVQPGMRLDDIEKPYREADRAAKAKDRVSK